MMFAFGFFVFFAWIKLSVVSLNSIINKNGLMGFSRLLPDIADSVHMYRTSFVKAMEFQDVQLAIFWAKKINAVMPDEFTILVFKNEKEFEKFKNDDTKKHDSEYYGFEDEELTLDDVMLELEVNETDIENRLNFQSNGFVWVSKFMDLIERQVTAWRLTYKIEGGEE